jgi:hypothetical protein
MSKRKSTNRATRFAGRTDQPNIAMWANAESAAAVEENGEVLLTSSRKTGCSLDFVYVFL